MLLKKENEQLKDNWNKLREYVGVEWYSYDNDSVECEVFNKDLGKNMYWNKKNIVGVTNEKAVGILYIDDRGYRYSNLEELKMFIDNLGE